MEIINIIAIILSPIIAIYVSTYISDRKEKRREQQYILRLLISTQFIVTDARRVEALNIIPIIFKDSKKTMQQYYKYKNLHTELRNSNLNPEGVHFISKSADLRDAYVRLLDCMAQELGYGEDLTWDKLKDPITPTPVTLSDGTQQWL